MLITVSCLTGDAQPLEVALPVSPKVKKRASKHVSCTPKGLKKPGQPSDIDIGNHHEMTNQPPILHSHPSAVQSSNSHSDPAAAGQSLYSQSSEYKRPGGTGWRKQWRHWRCGRWWWWLRQWQWSSRCWDVTKCASCSSDLHISLLHSEAIACVKLTFTAKSCVVQFIIINIDTITKFSYFWWKILWTLCEWISLKHLILLTVNWIAFDTCFGCEVLFILMATHCFLPVCGSQTLSTARWIFTKLTAFMYFGTNKCILFLILKYIVQGEPKKWTPNVVHITSSNIGRFSKLFHCYNLRKICNAAFINYSTTPQTLRYTTLWNIYVTKPSCPVRCGSFAGKRTLENPVLWLTAAATLYKMYWLNCSTTFLYQFLILFVITQGGPKSYSPPAVSKKVVLRAAIEANTSL